MKIIKARYDLIYFFFLPFCLISTLLYFFFFNSFIHLSLVNWIFTIFLLLFVLCPQASICLGDESSRSHYFKWFSKLFLSQLLITLLAFSFFQLISVNLTTYQSIPTFNLAEFSLRNGLFPWGFMILLAITLGYFTYRKKEMGLLSSAFKPFFQNSHIDSIGVAVDSYMRFIPICIMIFLFTAISLSLSLLIQSWMDVTLAVGFRFKMILVSCALLLIVSHRLWLKFLHHLMFHNVPIIVILLFFSFLLGVLYPLLSVIADFLVRLNPMLDVELRPTNFTFHREYTLIIMTFWWLGLSALNAGYIAYVSRNRSIREIILGSLISAVISLAVMMMLQNFFIKISSSTAPALIVMIVSATLLLVIMLKKENSTYFLRATLPTDEPIKMRSSFKFLRIVPLAVVGLFCAYLALGLQIWSYLMVLGFLPSIVIITLSFISWMKVTLAI